jgi:hypothetical protein
MKQVVTISGPKGSGKSEVANTLKEKGYIEVPMAQHLKQVCSDVFRLPIKMFLDPNLKEEGFVQPLTMTKDNLAHILTAFGVSVSYIVEPVLYYTVLDVTWNKHKNVEYTSPRHILQYVGTDILRDIDPDIHLRNLKLPDHNLLVISDCRFLNELEFFINKNDSSELSLIPLYINRKTKKNQLSSHASETEIAKLRPFCLEIENNGTLAKLKKEVELRLIRR